MSETLFHFSFAVDDLDQAWNEKGELLMPLAAGEIDRDIVLWTVIAIPATYFGNWLGTWAFHRAKPHHHRMTALSVLSVLSVVLIARALLDRKSHV